MNEMHGDFLIGAILVFWGLAFVYALIKDLIARRTRKRRVRDVAAATR